MRKDLTKSRTGLVAALDVGSTKVCCFIARADRDDGVRVAGIGHQMSKGVKHGAIVDMAAAEDSIRSAVHAAEQMAGENIDQVFLNVSCGNPFSHTIDAEIPTDGREIDDQDVRRVLEEGLGRHRPEDRELLHMIPVGFSIDGCRGIRDPRGMFGRRLGVGMHVVSAGAGAVRNLATCLARCRLDVEGYVVSPYASGLACLVEDEMDLGVTLIDMGGGTTSIAVFFDGEAVYVDTIPIGGGHVTNDIARGLTTPVAEAERLKTLYGGALPSSVDDNEFIDVPQIGEVERSQPNHIPKSILVGMIQPRLEETFELVRSRLEASGFDRLAGRRVVLSGGASQIPDVADLARLVLDKQIRMGRPIRVAGIAESTGGPAFATAAGLLTYAVQKTFMLPGRKAGASLAPPGLFGRLGTWLSQNL